MMQTKLFPALSVAVAAARSMPIAAQRKEILQVLIDYIQLKLNAGDAVCLNFICTHNSRRSQFSQIWAQTAADYFGIPVVCYSGGVEVTEFNHRAVDSIQRSGFQVKKNGSKNPVYEVVHSEGSEPILAFSKLFDDPVNQAKSFAAVMTCAHADETCPFIPGTEQRIPVRYEDPKKYDDSPEEAMRYDERSMQIASEMFYVFSQVNHS